VESKIKADVQAAKQKAAAERAAQQQLLSAALSSGRSNSNKLGLGASYAAASAWSRDAIRAGYGLPDVAGGGSSMGTFRDQSGEGQMQLQGAAGVAGNSRANCGQVVSIADNFLANPLSAWFLGGSSSIPTCQPGVMEYRQVVDLGDAGGEAQVRGDVPAHHCKQLCLGLL
jgi:hypothetical protein